MKNHHFDIPEIDDNREYDYSKNESQIRAEYEYIIDFVKPSSKVIDLGCGNGSLLELLRESKQVIPYGIELSESGVELCIKKNLKVTHGRIDTKLDFEDNFFDYAICNVTMQMVMYPEVLISEMKRVAKYLIISFPNFAFYKNRIELFFNGKMPTSMLFGYSWYSTGHIHQFSIKDFLALVNSSSDLEIIEHKFVKQSSEIKNLLMSIFPNLFQHIPIFLLETKK